MAQAKTTLILFLKLPVHMIHMKMICCHEHGSLMKVYQQVLKNNI